MTLYHVLALSGILFSIGVYGALTRRNILGILMSIELMFNAANINFIGFNHFLHPGNVWGHGFAIFIVTVAVAEAVVGMSLVLTIYRNTKSIYLDEINIFHG
jgi:NADH:ubiquinone oxidoreductase subunit K